MAAEPNDAARRVEQTRLAAAAQAALGDARAALIAWPVPDDARYQGEYMMVSAAAHLITALIADIEDASAFDRPIERIAASGFDLDWLRILFGDYAIDKQVLGHKHADQQRRASAAINAATNIAELHVGVYVRFITEHDAGYLARRTSATSRKRRRSEPISAAELATLIDRLGSLRPRMTDEVQAALDELLDCLRNDIGRVTECVSEFAEVIARAPPSAALTECGALLVGAASGLGAAADEAADHAPEPPAKVARVA